MASELWMQQSEEFITKIRKTLGDDGKFFGGDDLENDLDKELEREEMMEEMREQMRLHP